MNIPSQNERWTCRHATDTCWIIYCIFISTKTFPSLSFLGLPHLSSWSVHFKQHWCTFLKTLWSGQQFRPGKLCPISSLLEQLERFNHKHFIRGVFLHILEKCKVFVVKDLKNYKRGTVKMKGFWCKIPTSTCPKKMQEAITFNSYGYFDWKWPSPSQPFIWSLPLYNIQKCIRTNLCKLRFIVS